MSFTPITVTGTYKDEAGNALSGSVSFLLSDTLIDGAGDTRTPVRVVCALDAGGHFSTSLVATDDPTTLPVGAGYHVIEAVGGVTRQYDITVQYNRPGGVLDLGTVTPAVLTNPSATYATLTDVNRLATYDVSGMTQGTSAASATVLRFVSVRSWQLPQNLTGSAGAVGTNPASTATFTINKNGSGVGSFAISTGGVFTFTMASATTLAAGDTLTVVGPNPADTTLADVAFTLKGAAL